MAQDSLNFNLRKIETSLLIGYAEDNLTWSIAGNLNGQNPNIYSELIWEGLKGPQTRLNIKYNFWKSFILISDFTHFSILTGSATDSDYEEDNRTSRIFFAELNSDKGRNYSFNPALGYRFNFFGRMHLLPSIGYGINSQKLYLLDAQVPELKSTYQTLWKGPFAGLETSLDVFNTIKCQIGLRYHQVSYKAQADWNLIEEFKHPVSFEHVAKGYGIDADLRIGFEITRSFTAHLSSNYYKWSTGTGFDELFLTDGRVVKTRLNGVIRRGFTAGLGITFFY